MSPAISLRELPIATGAPSSLTISDDLQTPAIANQFSAAREAINASLDLLMYAETEQASADAYSTLLGSACGPRQRLANPSSRSGDRHAKAGLRALTQASRSRRHRWLPSIDDAGRCGERSRWARPIFRPQGQTVGPRQAAARQLHMSAHRLRGVCSPWSGSSTRRSLCAVVAPNARRRCTAGHRPQAFAHRWRAARLLVHRSGRRPGAYGGRDGYCSRDTSSHAGGVGARHLGEHKCGYLRVRGVAPADRHERNRRRGGCYRLAPVALPAALAERSVSEHRGLLLE